MLKVAVSSLLLAVVQIAAALPPVLNTDPTVLTTSPGSHESGPVAFWQNPWHNGATLDGTARVTTPLDWALFAAPDAPDGPGSRSFGGVDLATGGLTHRDVQLSLPAHAGWPIAVSYSSEPLSATGAGGVLGRGWFLDTMPVLVTGSGQPNAVMYLVYSADAFVTYRPVSSGEDTVWVGTNGAAGTLRSPSVSGAPWTLDLPDGVRAEFFDQRLEEDGDNLRRLWRYTIGVDDPGTEQIREDATAYVGHPSIAATAFTDAFDEDGRLRAAFDSAGRRYDFVYSAPNENLPSGRLIRVDVVLPGAAAPLVARVSYGYLGDPEIPAQVNAGSTLAEIEVQTWGEGTSASIPAQSPDSAKITKRFGYADVLASEPPQARLSRVFGYEAVRRNRLEGSLALDLWAEPLDKVHPYASVFASWSASPVDGRPVVAWTMIDGLGDVGAGVNGRWNFSFDGSGVASGTDEWIRRAVIQAPLRPVASVTTTGNSPALSDEQGRTWTIQYFGPTMQADTRVVSPVAPSSLGAGSGAGAWVNHVTRDSHGRVSRLLSPARVADFVYDVGTTGSRTIGATEKTGVEGASTALQRVAGTGAAAGMVEHVIDERRSDAFGGKQITYVYSDLTIPDRTRRVWVNATKRYTDRPEHAHVPSRELVDTTDVAFWPNSVVPKLIRTTPPLVSTEVLEGSSAPVARQTWTLMDRLGQRIGIFSPKKVLEEWAYDPRTGVLLRHTSDANATGAVEEGKFAAHNDLLDLKLLDSGAPYAVSGEALPYEVSTRYTYDHVGRVTFTGHPSGRISRTMRSVLPDGRLVVVDVPYLFLGGATSPQQVWSFDRAKEAGWTRQEEGVLRDLDDVPGQFYGLAPSGLAGCLHAGVAPFVAIGHEGNVESRGTLSLGNSTVTTPRLVLPTTPTSGGSVSPINLVHGAAATSGWFSVLPTSGALVARAPIPALVQSGVTVGELVERVLTPTGSREIERATYPLVNAQNFTAQNSSMTVSGPGNVFGGTADSHYFLTSTRYDQMGRVMAVRDQTNTIDIVRYDVIGRPVATQIGTHLPLLSGQFSLPGFDTPGTTSAGAPRLTRAMAYDEDSSGVNQFGNSLPTTVTAFRSGTMLDAVQRRFQYDQHEQVVASIGLSDPAPHYAASYDRNGFVRQSAVFRGPSTAALTAALKPDTTSFGGAGGGNRQMLVDSQLDERFRRSATVRTPINEHTGAVAVGLSAMTESFTYGATGKPVLVVGMSGTAEKTEYNRTCSVTARFAITSQSATGVAYGAVTGRMSDATSTASTTFVVMRQTNFVNDPFGGRTVSVVSATAPAGYDSGPGALFGTDIANGTREMFNGWRGGGARLEIYREPSRPWPELDITTRGSKLPDIIWCNTMTTRGLIDADQNLVGGANEISVALDGHSTPSVGDSPSSGPDLISTASGFSGLGMAIRNEQELNKFGLLDTQWQKESQDGKHDFTTMNRDLDLVPKSMFIEIDCEAECAKRRKILEEFSLGRLKKKTIMPFTGCPGAKQESFFGYPDSPLEGGPWFPDGWDPDADKHSNREVMVERPMGYAIPEGFVIDSDGNVVPISGSGGSPPAGSTDGIYTQRDLFGNPKRIANPLFSTEPFNHIPPAQRHMLMGYKGELGMMMLLPEPEVRTAIPPGGTGAMHELKQLERHWGGGLNWGTSGKTSEFALPSDFPGMPGDYNGALPNATRFLRDGLGGLEGITNRRNADPSALRGEAVYTDNDLKFTPATPGGGLPPSRPRITEMELPGGTKINPQYGTTPGGWGPSSEQRAIQSGQPLGMAIKGFTDVNLDFLGIGGDGGAAALQLRELKYWEVLSPLALPKLPSQLNPPMSMSSRMVPPESPNGDNWQVGGRRVYTWAGMQDGPVVQPIIGELPPIEEYKLSTSLGRVVAAQDFMGSSRAMVAFGGTKWTAASSLNHETDPPLEAQNNGRDILNNYFSCKDGLGVQVAGRYSSIDDALASIAILQNRSAGAGDTTVESSTVHNATPPPVDAGIDSTETVETMDPPFNLPCGQAEPKDEFEDGEWPPFMYPTHPEPCPGTNETPGAGGAEEFYQLFRNSSPASEGGPTTHIPIGAQNPGSNDHLARSIDRNRFDWSQPRPDVTPALAQLPAPDGGGFAAPVWSDLTAEEQSVWIELYEFARIDVFFSMVMSWPISTPSIERAKENARPGDRIEQSLIDPYSNKRLGSVDHNNLQGNFDGGGRIPRYDLAGNLTDDGKGRKYVYDAQGRLVGVYAYELNQEANSYGPGFWDAPKLSPVAIYAYDALGRLSRATFNTNGDNAVDAYDWREEYGYDHLWRLAAIWRQGPSADVNDDGRRPDRYLYQQYVQVMSGYGGWGADNHRGRLDSVVCRYRNTTGPTGKLDEIVYYVTNWRGDVTAIWEPGIKGVTTGDEQSVSRAVIRERVRYTAWGIPTRIAAADINWDGVQDSADETALHAAISESLSGASYVPRADLNNDGMVDMWDLIIFADTVEFDRSGRGELSATDLSGLSYGFSTGERYNLDNRIGFGGYMWDPWLGAYHVRHRVYDPNLRRWLQVDPIGYAGGDWDLSRYCNGDPVNFVDPSGLFIEGTFWNRVIEGPVLGFVVGVSDGITLGVTTVGRQLTGTTTTIDTQSGAYGVGVGVGVGVTTALSAGAAGVGVGTTALVAEGVFVGSATSVITQNAQLTSGQRSNPDYRDVVEQGVLGGLMGGVFGKAMEILKKVFNGGGAAGASGGAGKPTSGGTASCGAGNGVGNADDLLRAAQRPYNNSGISEAARKIEQHGAGDPTYPRMTGNVASKNEAASAYVESILKNPSTTVDSYVHPNYGPITDIRRPDGYGLRYRQNGSFMTVLDPPVP